MNEFRPRFFVAESRAAVGLAGNGDNWIAQDLPSDSTALGERRRVSLWSLTESHQPACSLVSGLTLHGPSAELQAALPVGSEFVLVLVPVGEAGAAGETPEPGVVRTISSSQLKQLNHLMCVAETLRCTWSRLGAAAAAGDFSERLDELATGLTNLCVDLHIGEPDGARVIGSPSVAGG